MKPLKPHKNIKVIINSIFILLILLFFQNCEEKEEDKVCTGCTSNQPYSKPGQNTCYATLADCEAALGTGCIVCN
jgi:hypothetical protein